MITTTASRLGTRRPCGNDRWPWEAWPPTWLLISSRCYKVSFIFIWIITFRQAVGELVLLIPHMCIQEERVVEGQAQSISFPCFTIRNNAMLTVLQVSKSKVQHSVKTHQSRPQSYVLTGLHWGSSGNFRPPRTPPSSDALAPADR